ncbi:pseudouridine synthase [Inquilinus sp. 2KB_12]|uniref:pseudouridine synthase n=2 Tax=unclassified Inquilinus TaxID=2645927 RepID=UPI003F8E5299
MTKPPRPPKSGAGRPPRGGAGSKPTDRRSAKPPTAGEGEAAGHGPRRPPRGRSPRTDDAPPVSLSGHGPGRKARPAKAPRFLPAEPDAGDHAERRPAPRGRSAAPRPARREESPAASTERRPARAGQRPRARTTEDEAVGERRPTRTRNAAPRPARREESPTPSAERRPVRADQRPGRPRARATEDEAGAERRPSRGRAAAPAARSPRRDDRAASEDAPRSGRGKAPSTRAAAPKGKRDLAGADRRHSEESRDDSRAGRRGPATGARGAKPGDPPAGARRPARGKPGAKSRPGADKGGEFATIPEWLWDGGEEPPEEIVPDRRRPRGRVPSVTARGKAEDPPEPAVAPAARPRPSVARPLTSSRKLIGDAPRAKSAKPGERWREERKTRPAPAPDQCRYVLLHKPYGVLSQFTPEGRWRGLNEFGLPPGIYAAGRLDADSEGLLLLTDDGPLIKRLLDPKHGHPRTYLVQVEGEPADEALEALAQGIALTDGPTKPCLADRLDAEPDLPPRDPPIRFRLSIPATWMRLTLTEGRNRQVRRMTAAVGHPTLRLVRVAIGDVELGDLPPGSWTTVDRETILPALR